MNKPWGKFTVRGGPDVEQTIREMVTEVGRIVEGAVAPGERRALLLIGGYGRGEGGIERRDGRESPHNNLDFLLVTPPMDARREAGLKAKIDQLLRPIIERYGVGIDLSTVSTLKLRSSPCLILWHDMREGHKTILGDPEFAPRLKRFDADQIRPWDARNLLVNRGTLLLINRLLLRRASPSEPEKRMVIRHAVKAVIGYGDALLFFLGRYHWSYVEKQRRMAAETGVPGEFRKLYDWAMEFRFEPRYEQELDRDLASWNEELRRSLSPVHLRCERIRLGRPALEWTGYPAAALAHALFDDWWVPRSAVRKLYHLVRSSRAPASLPFVAALGFRAAGPRGTLPLLFPLVGYRLEDEYYLRVGREALGSDDLETAYLRQWSLHGDTNFAALLERLGLRPGGAP